MTDGPTSRRYVDARWPDLVGGLEDEGVAGRPRAARGRRGPAGRAVGRGRAGCATSRSTSRLWAEVRERAGLPARPGEPAPHGVRPSRPARRARRSGSSARGRLRAARRRRRATSVPSAGSRSRPCSPPGGRGGRRSRSRRRCARRPTRSRSLVRRGRAAPRGRRGRAAGGRGVRRRLRRRCVAAPWSPGCARARSCGWTPTARSSRSTRRPPPSTRSRWRRPLRGLGRYDVRVESVPLARRRVGPPRRLRAPGRCRRTPCGSRSPGVARVVVCPTEWTCAGAGHGPRAAARSGCAEVPVPAARVAPRGRSTCGQVWRRPTRGASPACAPARSRRCWPACRATGGCSTSGAAPARWSQAAREAGHDAVGVEPDPEMAALASAALGADVVVAGLPDLPLRRRRLRRGDGVTSCSTTSTTPAPERASWRGWPRPAASCARRSGARPRRRRR